MGTCWHVQTGQRAQQQALIAGGGLIAFQHFHLRQRQVFDDRQVGKQPRSAGIPCPRGNAVSPDVVFVVHNNAVNGNFAFLHCSRPLTVLISVDLLRNPMARRLPPPHLFTSVEQSVST